MTSPALFVIFTTLVFSIFGIVLESTADYETNKMALSLQSIPHWVHKYQHFQAHHTNLNEPKPKHGNLKEKHNINEIKTTKEQNTKSKIDNTVNNEIDYDLDYIQNRNLELHRMRLKQDRLIDDNHIDTRAVSQYRHSKKPNTLHKNMDKKRKETDKLRHFNDRNEVITRYKRDTDQDRCEGFQYDKLDKTITHPHAKNGLNMNYYNNTNCVAKINASSDEVIELTFVDVFHIEHHPECAYDYLEIRDGYYGYADLLGKFCGEAFPRTLITKGPHAWLKFHSDDTIEYEGFKIQVNFKPGGPSTYVIPDKCYIKVSDKAGEIKINDTGECVPEKTRPLDVLWTIETAPDTKIYLNFTTYKLASPNECSENKIQIFETAKQELDTELAEYCGSIANSVTSNKNVVYIRLFASKTARGNINFAVTFNQFRTVDGSKGEKCDIREEFDCEDSTCIDASLYCDKTAHCRLKADEEGCDPKTVSTLSETHILVILVIFSLILSGMSFVFLYKCIRKLYQDHKIIKEHIRQSCEDRDILGSRLTLDPKELQRDCDPRASLERENVTNEIVKNQRSYSKQKQTSLDSSDYIQETAVDLQEEDWSAEVNNIPLAAQDIRIERNGRTRRSDFSKKEESIRSRTKDSDKEKREIRDVSVGAPDTKESGCQTRESLFQTEPPASSDGSGSNSRGFSTFGYSGATIARRSPPTNTSEVTIELLKQVPPQETKPLKKLPDRRPSSTETTRSAPDVIIVSKPIR